VTKDGVFFFSAFAKKYYVTWIFKIDFECLGKVMFRQSNVQAK
jgi:hypothetical protein